MCRAQWVDGSQNVYPGPRVSVISQEFVWNRFLGLKNSKLTKLDILGVGPNNLCLHKPPDTHESLRTIGLENTAEPEQALIGTICFVFYFSNLILSYFSYHHLKRVVCVHTLLFPFFLQATLIRGFCPLLELPCWVSPDLPVAKPNGGFSIPIWTDQSAAFDSVDHCLLFDMLYFSSRTSCFLGFLPTFWLLHIMFFSLLLLASLFLPDL